MIHQAYTLFLAVYLAHLLTDFVFQTDRLVSKKHRGEWHGYLVHGATHYIAVLAIVAIAAPHRFLTWYFQLIAVSLSIAHLLVDWAKLSLTNSLLIPYNVLAFVPVQLIPLPTSIR